MNARRTQRNKEEMAIQFIIADIQYIMHACGPKDCALMPRRIGIKSASVTCRCGHGWVAKTAPDLYGLLGAVRVRCPICEKTEAVSRQELQF